MAAATSFLLGFIARSVLARLGVIDKPNPRSSHTVPVVRGGGIAIGLAILLGTFLAGSHEPRGVLVLVAVALAVAAVSLIDDLQPVEPTIRLSFHVAAGVWCLVTFQISEIHLTMTGSGGLQLPVVASWVVGFLWIVGYTNAFNFMDGINGLAAGQAAVTGLGTALLGGLALRDFSDAPVVLSLVVGAAAVGFLPHNFPRARMFMGDVGSAPLGFLLASLAVWMARDHGWWLLIPLGLLHANFVLDTGITLARRLVRGERWQEAHREHFYQRLVRSGRSHSFVTGWEMGLQGIVLLLMVSYVYAPVLLRLGLIAAVMATWLAFFGYCEIRFQRGQRSHFPQ